VYNEGISYTLADFIQRQNPQTPVALVYKQGEPFMELLANAFQRRYRGPMVAMQGYSDPPNFAANAAMVQGAGAQAVVVLGFDETGALLSQMRASGFQGNFYGADTWTSPGFIQQAGQGANAGFYLTDLAPQNAAYAQWAQAYQQAYGTAPNLFALTGHDAVVTLFSALQATGGQTGEPLRQQLLQVRQFTGASPSLQIVNGNPITVDQDGVSRATREEIYQYANGAYNRIGFVQ
jgi:branched-chain amino acid transport system substrate-binding protein